MARAFVFPVLVAAMLLGAAESRAKVIYDGDYFNTLCSSRVTSHIRLCEAYVTTVAHAMNGSPVDGIRACVPAIGRSWVMLKNIAVQWVAERPEHWDSPATTLIAAALADHFPCKYGQ